MTSDETDGSAVDDGVSPTEAEPVAHQPDGLDLARAAARAAAASPGTPARRRPAPAFRRRTTTTSSGARPDDRDPQPLGSAMGRLIAQHGWELDLKVQGVFGRWAELVAQVTAMSTPEVVVEVEDLPTS